MRFATGLYNAYVATDASLAEINPLVVTDGGEVLALDAKMNFDDNALFRHPNIAAMRDPDEEDPDGDEAKEYDLSYIALDGNIGCMVNGAGLAMATMDIIKLSGGRPANFLDVGGGADEEQVTAAFKIILSDPKVQGDPRQHLRRHHEVRRHRERRRRGGEAGRARRCRSSCGSRARTSSWARRSSPTAGSTSSPPTTRRRGAQGGRGGTGGLNGRS